MPKALRISLAINIITLWHVKVDIPSHGNGSVFGVYDRFDSCGKFRAWCAINRGSLWRVN